MTATAAQNSGTTKMDTRSEEMVVEDFDGTPIASIEARLPAFVVEMPEGYKRGTHLKMEIEFRVRSVRYEENRKGELTHQMVLAVEDIELKKIIRPEEEVILLGTVESDGIPTDYGQAPDFDTPDPDPEWCEEHQKYDCNHEIDGQVSIEDLSVPESPEELALVPDAAWEAKGPQGPLSALDAGF